MDRVSVTGQPSDQCSLDRNDLPKRLADWQQLLAACDITRDGTGATAVLSADVPLGAVAELVEAEVDCCSFFTFEIHVESAGRRLRVSAPAAQQPMIDLLVGTAQQATPDNG